MTETKIQPRKMRERQAAAYIGLAPGTLRNMRHQHRGPRYSKAGRTVLYDRIDLDAWLDSLPTVDPAEMVAA